MEAAQSGKLNLLLLTEAWHPGSMLHGLHSAILNHSIKQKDADVRISEDAGHFLCDFIYYSSLSHLYSHHPNRPRKVLFLHVPTDANDETIPRGRELALSLIRSVVESEVLAREKQ